MTDDTMPAVPLAELSKDQRRAILLLEVAALLHDVRKLAPKFIADMDSETPNSVRRQDIWKHEFDKNRASIHDLLRETKLLSSSGAETTLETIVFPPIGDEASEEPLALLLHGSRGIHGKAHYEKSNAGERQTRGQTYTATPFGHEAPLALTTQTAEILAEYLTPGWLERMAAGGEERTAWLAAVRPLLMSGLAATQRPMNEVNLWDWGATAAVLLKPIAYAGYTTKKWASRDHPLDNFHYTPLHLRLDRLRLYSRADRISDLLGLQQALDGAGGAADRARVLLEETYALGNRYHRDELGDYYLLPRLDETGCAALKKELLDIFPLDVRPRVVFGKDIRLGDLDNQATRADNVRQLVSQRREEANKETGREFVAGDNFAPDAHAKLWQGHQGQAEICYVCRLRPVGSVGGAGDEKPDRFATPDKASKRRLCCVCLSRRQRRSEQWLKAIAGSSLVTPHSSPPATIWTDEVADDDGRLALFVGRLGLDGWLDGNALASLPDGGGGTKLPSPARLYRIAETARAFWGEVIDQDAPVAVGPRHDRHALRVDGLLDPVVAEKLGVAHAYELNAGGLPLSVVWDPDRNRFVTAENLAAYEKRGGRHLDEWSATAAVIEPSGFLRPTEGRGKVRLHSPEELPPYVPLIELLREPGVCLLLVPGDRALALAVAVEDRHREQMGRVLDRLPLTVGLVYFRRRTPLAAALDAARRMIGGLPAGVEEWTAEYDGSTVSFTSDGRAFGHTYPADKWYARLLIKPPPDQKEATPEWKAVTDFGPKPITVSLRPGRFDFEFLDAAARRFELVYAKGRRPSQPSRPWLVADVKRLEGDWAILTGRLRPSQLRQVITTIETTRDAWRLPAGPEAAQDEVFKQFVEDTLAGATWPKGQGWATLGGIAQKELIDAGVAGELADWAELHLEIMKGKDPQVQKEPAAAPDSHEEAIQS